MKTFSCRIEFCKLKNMTEDSIKIWVIFCVHFEKFVKIYHADKMQKKGPKNKKFIPRKISEYIVYLNRVSHEYDRYI